MNVNDRGNKEELPPGWSYNPSRWRHRLPLVLAACVGLAIALYLTAYQIRWIKRVEDPFFGYGSDIVLNSPLSTLLPIPDAALGALGYFVDVAAGLIGGSLRWKTLPWMVLLFGGTAGMLGFSSVVLAILQGVKFEAYCTLCLCSAATSVLVAGPAADEVLATLQHLKRAQAQNISLWRALRGTD